MRFFLSLLLGFLALCTQLFLQETFALDSWSPNLLVVFLVWLGIQHPSSQSLLLAAILGLLMDGFAASPLGFYMLHSLLIYLAALSLNQRLSFQSFFSSAFLGLAAGLMSLFLFGVLSRIFLDNPLLSQHLSRQLLPHLLLIILCTILGFPLLNRFDTLSSPRADREFL